MKEPVETVLLNFKDKDRDNPRGSKEQAKKFCD